MEALTAGVVPVNHQVLAPTYTDAQDLSHAIHMAGWFARIVQRNQHVGVIVHAPESVLVKACLDVGFVPGRTLSP